MENEKCFQLLSLVTFHGQLEKYVASSKGSYQVFFVRWFSGVPNLAPLRNRIDTDNEMVEGEGG